MIRIPKKKLKARLKLFGADPDSPVLNNCSLREKGEGLWSINTAGDLRVIYEPAGKESVLLLAVDTRGSLYS